MAEIVRDVIIKAPIKQGRWIVIKGIKGGELKFLLTRNTEINRVLSESRHQPLLVNSYRPDGLSMDTSDYHGNKGDKIKIKKDNGKNGFSTNSFILYLIDSNNKLIEYGKLKRIKGYNAYATLFVYEIKKTHRFKKVKIICCEELCQ